MRDDPDLTGGYLAGIKPQIRKTRTVGPPSNDYAYKGQETSFEEQDRKHYYLLDLYGPQEEKKPRRR